VRQQGLSILALAVVAVGLLADVAQADDGISGGGWVDNGTPTVGIRQIEQRGGGGAPAPSACLLYKTPSPRDKRHSRIAWCG
jgi:hypothetical protein